MPGKRHKKPRKRTKYSKVTFKLTARQKKSLMNYCKARKTTPNKLIKKSIRRFITGFDQHVPIEYFTTENQLDLFEDPSEQLKIKLEEPETLPLKAGGEKGYPAYDLFSGKNPEIEI